MRTEIPKLVKEAPSVINQSINQVYYFSSTLQARFHSMKYCEILWNTRDADGSEFSYNYKQKRQKKLLSKEETSEQVHVFNKTEWKSEPDICVRIELAKTTVINHPLKSGTEDRMEDINNYMYRKWDSVKRCTAVVGSILRYGVKGNWEI